MSKSLKYRPKTVYITDEEIDDAIEEIDDEDEESDEE